MLELGQVLRDRRIKALVVAGLSALALAASAQAEDPSPTPPPPLPPTAGIGQYIEDVPSAAGPRAAGGDAQSRGAKLSRKAKKQLSKVDKSTAQTLERVATSPAYGAPEANVPAAANARVSKPKKPTAGPTGGAPTPAPGSSSGAANEPSAGSAVASAVRGDENGNLDVLLAALVVITAAAVGASVARARRARAG